MRIVLIRPRYYTHIISPPLGLGYLAAACASRGHDVAVIDALLEGLAPGEVVKRAEGADLAGITVMSDYFHEASELAGMLKAAGMRVVLGGPHVTALPGETLEQTGADFACLGEGEEVILDLIERLSRGEAPSDIPGLVCANDAGACRPRPPPEDLDSLPPPLWSLMPPRLYGKAPHGGVVKALPLGSLITSRGCPFDCSYCFNSRLAGKRQRRRSPRLVADEIEMLVREFRVKEIHFIDDNLTLHRSHIEEICMEILDRRLAIHWAAPNGIRVDSADSSLFKLMKRSGCYFVSFGIESADDGILERAGKRIDIETVKRAVRDAAAAGIITQGFFIFGLPGETLETMRKTLALALELPLKKAQFHLLDVLPGTRLWEELEGAHRPDWHKRSFQEVKWVPEGLTEEALKRFLSYAFRRFYLRPGPLGCILSLLRPGQIPSLFRRLNDFGVLPLKPWKR